MLWQFSGYKPKPRAALWKSLFRTRLEPVMSNPQWKRVERQIAAILGGRRVPVSGRQRGDQPDIEHPAYSIEVKSRNTLPGWLLEAVEQATASATGGRIPIAVLHQNGRKYTDALVVVRLADFQRLTSQNDRAPPEARGCPESHETTDTQPVL